MPHAQRHATSRPAAPPRPGVESRLVGDLDLALSGQADPLDRGRELARELYAVDATTATLIDELCDEIERRRREVRRLGLDLHDEALQDVTALRNDLQHFRAQVAEGGSEGDLRRHAAGRVDDFLARVEGVDRALRELVAPSRRSSALVLPLAAMLESIVEDYSGPGDLTLHLPPDLDACALTDSQRIATVRVVQSAVANVAQHSDAVNASITVRCSAEALECEISDDGRGFDVAAGSDDRLGLSGMRERVALLGGTLDVWSAREGPTTIAFRLPGPRSS